MDDDEYGEELDALVSQALKKDLTPQS